MSFLNKLISLKEASKISGYNSDYLSFLIRSGKLKGQRVGRSWFVLKGDIEKFNQPKINPKKASLKLSYLLILSGLILGLFLMLFTAKANPGFLSSFFANFATVFLAGGSPQTNYQGKLTEATGIAVTNGGYNIRFKLYNSSTGGSPIWTESHCYSSDAGSTCSGSGTDSRINVTSGLFSVMLGSVNSLSSVDFNQVLYLGVEIGGTNASPVSGDWDGEMSPRKRIGTVPSAFIANTLNGISDNQFVRLDTANATSSTGSLLTLTQNGTGNILDLYASTTKVVTVLANGNVGVGTLLPGANLDVTGTTIFRPTDSDSFQIGVSNINTTLNLAGKRVIFGYIASPQKGVFQTQNMPMIFATGFNGLGNGETMRITNSGSSNVPGKVGIGTVNPASVLSVVGAGATFGEAMNWTGSVDYGGTNRGYLGYDAAGATTAFIGNESTGGDAISAKFQIRMGTSAKVTVMSSGNVGIGTTTPATALSVIGTSTTQGLRISNLSNSFLAVDATGNVTATTSPVSSQWTSSSTDISYVAGNVGIGTTSPASKLDVRGNLQVGTSSIPLLFVNSSTGNVGIGKANPLYPLDVNGGASFSSSIRGTSFSNYTTYNNSYWQLLDTGSSISRNIADANTTLIVKQTHASSTGDILQLQNRASTVLTVQRGGNVGIGTTTPTTALSVIGTSTTQGLNISTLSNSLLAVDASGNVVATTTQDLSGYISTTTALSSYLTLDQTIPQTATGTFTFPKVVSPMIDFGNKTTLVTNGTFTTDLTGWTDASNSPSNIIWETGWLKLVVSSAATARARQSVTTEIGKTYMFTFNTKTYKAQTGFKLGTTLGGGEYYNIAADGTSYLSNEYKFTATTTTTYIEFNAGTIAYGYIDDVKLYQYAGNISGLTVDNSLIVGKNIYADRIQLPRYDGGVGVQPSLTIGNFGGANFASGYGVALGIVGGMAMQRVSDTSYSYLFSVRSADASTPLFRIFSNNSATPDFTIGNMVSNKSLNFDTNVQGVDSTGLQVGPAITVNRSTSFVQPTAGLGTISVSAGGTTVTGVGTLFLSTFKVGDTITSEGQTKTISAIASNTSLTTDAWGAAISAKAFTLTGGTRMVVNGNGNVGIRTTTPTGALHVVGDGTATRWLGLFTQTGVTPENSLTGSSVQNKMVSVQGSDGAFFMGRDVTNDIEFVMGTSVVGEVFAGAMTAHDMSLRTNNTDRLTVKATTGNVGIGTTTPTAKFTVYGQAPGTNGLANFIETSSSNAGAGMTGYADYTRAMATGERLGYFVLGGAKDNAHTLVNSAAITAVAAENWSSTAAGSDLTFNVTPKLSVTRAEKMRILSSGNVGIGTSTPSATLTVLGTLQFSSLGSSGANLTTDSLGNVSASSDERLKDIQGSYQRGLADIMKIDPIRYKWKVETGYDTLNTYSGFSAQNMTLAIPEAVATSSSGFLTLADRPIIAALVNSVKQIGSFISKIQGGIAYLKNIVAETFAVGSQEKPSGITMYDESTGNPYCVKITNGILINEDGACGTIEPSESMFDYTATVLDTENSIASSTATSTESVSSTSTDSVISTSTDSISTSTTSITSGVSTTTEQTVASTTDDIIATSTTETEISTSTATTTSESEISTSTESVADVSENVEEALPYTEGETSVTNPVEQVIVQGAPTTTPESIEQIISVVEEVSTTTPAEETLQAPEENQNTDSTTELQQGASVFDIKISNQNLLIIIILVIQLLLALAFGFYIYDRRRKS